MSTVKTIQLRFKSPVASADTPLSQSLLINRTGSDNDSFQFGLFLEYTSSVTTSGSYSGSIISDYSQYGTLKFISGSVSASVYLPFFDGGWWSVMVNQESSSVYTYNLYAKNKPYIGENGSTIGFQASSSLLGSGSWEKPGTVQIPGSGSSTLSGGTYTPATSSFQEVRYFKTTLSESAFDDYVMNANSIEGNSINSSHDELTFRASLGGELYTGSTSIHPSVTGSTPSASFIDNTSAFGLSGSYDFISNKEVNFYDQSPVGIKNKNSNKIKKTTTILPESSSQENIPNADVLSPFRSIQQNSYVSESYTKDINYVEVAFSPQNEINDDIINQIGNFNIGEYIGDPREISSSSTFYPELDTLRDGYFKKYTHNYDVWDYIRLIKYFDNSLFKMVKDWVPSKTSLASGIIVKQHLLERNKYPTPQASKKQDDYYTGSISVSTITGSNGGSMPELFGATSSAILASGSITQSWSGTNQTISGSVAYTHVDQSEFFNGELSGSTIVVSTGSLMECMVGLEENHTQNGSSLSAQNINFSFKSDKSYYLKIEATNNTGFDTAAFHINDQTDGNYRFFTSRKIIDGDTFTKVLLIDNFSIDSKDLLTPNLSFTPVFGAGSGFELTASVFLNSISDDCRVLRGNATNNRSNTFFYDVDYSNNAVTAINLENILSGSNGDATKATVPDSNYTTRGIINSRYIGKELTAANLNKWTENDTSYGKTVTVGNPNTYFAYFNWVGGTSPEWGNHLSDRTAANIKYYIDENGDVIDPINDSEGINVGIARQNFQENLNAIISLDSDDEFGINLGALNASWPVFKSGYTIAPIIYTQTASYDSNGDVIDFGYTNSIDFVQGDLSPVPTVKDYQLTTFAEVGQSFDKFTTNQLITFQTPIIKGSSATFTSNVYSPDTGDDPSTEGVTLTVTAKIRASFLVNITATYELQTTSGTKLASTQINHNSTTGGEIIFVDANATDASTYKLVMTNASQGSTSTGLPLEVFLSPTTELIIQQQPLPGNGECTLFWNVNGSDRKIITANGASGGLNQFYGQTQKNITRSGFNPITLPFELQPGDEIRFEGTEDLAFEIKEVSQDSGTLQLTLDRNIPANTVTNYFLVRRYIDDPSYIIMEVDKPAGPSSGGILKPQYLSSQVETNLDTILENLQDKGLI